MICEYEQGKKFPLVSLSNMSPSFNIGRVGLHNIANRNKPYGAKLVWQMQVKTTSKWFICFKNFYFDSLDPSRIITVLDPLKRSSVWDFMMGSRELIASFVSQEVNNQEKSFFCLFNSWIGYPFLLMIHCKTTWTFLQIVGEYLFLIMYQQFPFTWGRYSGRIQLLFLFVLILKIFLNSFYWKGKFLCQANLIAFFGPHQKMGHTQLSRGILLFNLVRTMKGSIMHPVLLEQFSFVLLEQFSFAQGIILCFIN